MNNNCWQWTWEWTVSTHAHFGDNLFFDWVRVGCVVISGVLAMLILRVIIEQQRREHAMKLDQMLRFAALLIADISIALTEATAVGTPATPRLVCNLFAAGLGVVSIAAMRRRQRRTEVMYDSPRRLELPGRRSK